MSLINNLINSVNNISEYIILLFLIFVFIYFSYKKNILDKTGITASIIIGIMIFIGGGWKFIAIISSFYILGIATTNFRKSKKRINSITKEKSTTRSYTNVIANGGIASILAFASIMVESELLAIAFTGAILTATADTIATEIGLLSKSTPFLLLKPSKKCMKGESGGVTILGLTSSFISILIIGIISMVLGIINTQYQIIAIIIGGYGGNLIDSIMGGTIQRIGKCTECGDITENSTHHNKKVTIIRGNKNINNDVVNLIATIFGAMIATIFYLIII